MKKAERIFGYLAVASSFYTVLMGLFWQVINNYKRHSVEGLSLHFFLSIYVVYFLWAAYGFSKPKKDYYLIVPNILGLLVGSILLFQFIFYR